MKLKMIILTLIVIGILGISIGFYLYNKPQKDISKIKAELKIDAKTLFLEFEEDEDAANEKYLGKIIEVEGEVVTINKLDNGNTTVVFLDEMFGVTCTIDSFYVANNQNKISEISAGQEVAFKGKCDGMLTDVVLTKCIPVGIK